MEATEQEIYDQSIGEEVVETPVEAPPQEEAKSERVRDEKGRFVAAQEPAEPEPEAPQQTETERPAAKDEDGARVPSWRLAEEADRRRSAEQALNELKNELRQMQMQMYQMHQPQQAAPHQEDEPDIFADPQSFVKRMRDQYVQDMRQFRMEQSLKDAHRAHGDKFNEAYNEFTNYVSQSRDQAAYQRVMASNDPGEALVQWWKDQQLHKELNGSDLKTFLEKQREEWLKDPTVQAKVIEAFKATQQQAQPSNLTSLPPSLSKAAAARSAHDDGGSSGDDIYAYATKR